jgi:hypothetical protein
MTNTSIATVEQWYKDNAKIGVERITQEDLPIPMLQLVQRTSNLMLANGTPATFGKFYYTATKQQFDKFPCYILSAHTEERQKFTDKTQYEKVYVFLGVSADLGMPFKMIFRSSNIGSAKNFLGLVFASKRPIFATKVVMESKTVDGQKGTYVTIMLNDQGSEDRLEKLNTLKDLSEKYGSPAIGVPDEEVPEEVTVNSTSMFDSAVPEAEAAPQADANPDDIPF